MHFDSKWAMHIPDGRAHMKDLQLLHATCLHRQTDKGLASSYKLLVQ